MRATSHKIKFVKNFRKILEADAERKSKQLASK